ncbi:unnamed protein product, partial [Heterosigma akashiwo]
EDREHGRGAGHHPHPAVRQVRRLLQGTEPAPEDLERQLRPHHRPRPRGGVPP